MTGFPQIAQRMFNTPLLVDPAKAQAILMGFGARVLGQQLLMPSLDIPVPRADRARDRGPLLSVIDGESGNRRRERGDRLYPVIDGVALIDVTGSLVHRGSWLEGSGATSYERLHEKFSAVAADSSVRGVALEVDSFGGEASGCFDLADHIREVREEKPVYAFVAESAFSGGYAIASQADRIILPRTGEVGSIGVLCMHVDYSAQLEDEGVRVTLVTSGAHKAEGNPYEALPADVLERWQSRSDDLRRIFAETVAAGRGGRLSVDAALATEAACFMGQEAVDLGLADEVSDLRGAFAAFVEKVNGRTSATTVGALVSAEKKETTMSVKPNTTASAETEEVVVETTEETTAAVEDPPAPTVEPAPAQAAASVPATQAAELAEVAAQAAKLGVTVDLADAFRNGTSVEQLRASVLSTLAAKSAATNVSTQHTVHTQPESPLLAAAKKFAAAAARK